MTIIRIELSYVQPHTQAFHINHSKRLVPRALTLNNGEKHYLRTNFIRHKVSNRSFSRRHSSRPWKFVSPCILTKVTPFEEKYALSTSVSCSSSALLSFKEAWLCPWYPREAASALGRPETPDSLGDDSSGRSVSQTPKGSCEPSSINLSSTSFPPPLAPLLPPSRPTTRRWYGL